MIRNLLIAVFLVACNSSPHIASEPVENKGESCPMPPPRECSGAAWEVHFSPKGGTTEFLVQNINQAQESIYVQAYSFTSAPIAEALVAKHKQGVKVEVLLDKSDREGRGTQYPTLLRGGVSTFVDEKHAIAHNKIIIIDKKIVFTGSFNFTNAAENSNAENSIKLTDPKLAKVYLENWEVHRKHSL